jgi:hypothetical protein
VILAKLSFPVKVVATVTSLISPFPPPTACAVFGKPGGSFTRITALAHERPRRAMRCKTAIEIGSYAMHQEMLVAVQVRLFARREELAATPTRPFAAGAIFSN